MAMRIITWNCNMAYRKKAGLMQAYKPDILVIQECEHPDKLLFEQGLPKPADILWLGKNTHKGLAVISYGPFRLRLHRAYNPAFRIVAPIRIQGPESDLLLYAIWANNPDDPEGQYVTQVWKAIHYYQRMIRRTRTILAGDFNSNTIWDRPRRDGNHSDLVKRLARKNIRSVYHHFYNQEHGQEAHPTLYLYRSQERPYHIDYCFVSDDLLRRLESVEIGDYESWKKYSDHVPVIASFREE